MQRRPHRPDTQLTGLALSVLANHLIQPIDIGQELSATSQEHFSCGGQSQRVARP